MSVDYGDGTLLLGTRRLTHISRKLCVSPIWFLTHTILTRFLWFNRYRRKRQKVDASTFDSALSHTRRSTRRKKEKKIACPLLDVFACGQVSCPRLFRLILSS